MTHRAKSSLGCLIVAVSAFLLFCGLTTVVSNGTFGNNAHINVFAVRSAFTDATSDDFHQAQIQITEKPRELSSEELARFLLRKDQRAHATDPWGRLVQVTVWKRTGSNGGFCAGRVTSFVTKWPWGLDAQVTEEF